MKPLKICLTFIVLVASITFSNAQRFIKKESGKPLTFKEMQRQFDAWSKTVDLKSEKNWKYFKRWENEMQLHTNASGEPGNASIYIDEAIKAAQQKNIPPSNRFTTSVWSPVGPYSLPGNLTGYMKNGIGRINCIAFHPSNPNIYFVGVAQGGVWKTANNGLSWTPLTDNLPITRISDICIDPNNTSTMYISVCDFEYIDVALNIDGRKRNTHYGLGVYKTTDGGLSWQPTGLSFQLTNGDASLIRKILVNLGNSDQLVACGVSGMYTSADGGTTWAHPLDSLFWDMVQDPITPTTLYAATGWLASSNYGNAAIYKSVDFGSSWSLLNTGIPATGAVQRIKLAIAPSDNNYIYAMAVDGMDGSYGIYKSTDAGGNWQFIDPGLNMLEGNDGSNLGGQGTYDLGFSVKATDKNTVFVGGVNIWASTDGAQTFDPVSHWTLNYGPTLHGDIHFIETQASTGNIFVCSDGGLYRTTNIIPQTWSDANNGSPWPTQWTNIDNGLAITSFYRLSSSKNATGRLVAGAQDNATFYYDGTAWNTIFGGDGMDNYLDPLNDNVVIGAAQFGSFYISQDNGFSGWDPGTNVNNESGEWTTPIIADYNLPGTLYAGYTNVNKSTDGGNSWYSLAPLPVNGIYDNELSALAVANTNSDVIYAARRIRYEYNSPASMFKTPDAGATWLDITAGLPDSLYFTSIDVSQTAENTAYVSLAGFSTGNKVFRTIDGGNNWQNISFNLPNIPVNCVKTMPGSGTVLIATDLGVYSFNSGTNSWTSQSSGLPNVIISDIEFNPTLNKIYVATFGRGIWENDLSTMVGTNTIPRGTDIDIELFPSLNNGSFSIKVVEQNALNESLHLEIIDITGKTVYSSTLTGQAIYPQKLNLKPGMYFAKIRNKKLNGVKSFVVQ